MTSPSIGWHTGSLARAHPLTASARSITFAVPNWPGNDAGQHVDVRLTAPDGYQAVRSYSIASAGPGEEIELAIDRLPDGEVSPFLVDDLELGDTVELRGPLGGWFVWRPEQTPARPADRRGLRCRSIHRDDPHTRQRRQLRADAAALFAPHT